jgi:UDPglucose--hexose-1-phosphate uridylyltransferase
MKKSQLRQDLVSGDWILVSPGRGRRPHNLKTKSVPRKRSPKSKCPFEQILTPKGEQPALVIYDTKKQNDWSLQIIQNKFPAFTHKEVCSVEGNHGPYGIMDGVGHHDLLITRDHDKNMALLDENGALEVMTALQMHYRSLSKDKCLSYVSMFHNWGPRAGASIYHPHYQIISVPFVPPDIQHSLGGSSRYYKKKKKCAHCTIVDWELKENKRVIFKNQYAIAMAPFASETPFEIAVYPRIHNAYFEETSLDEMKGITIVLQSALNALRIGLNDPDYNYFIHTSPIKHKNKYHHYHWHIEIVPKITILAGFELGTGIEINVADPDEAAKYLKKFV